MKRTRREHDFIGEMEIREDAYYGIQTMRAVENFDITGRKLGEYSEFVKALAEVKKACSLANHELNLLPTNIKDAVVKACDRVIGGEFVDQFVVDMIQGGAGTSTNMNANEVIANIALEEMGHKKGEYEYCHPNDHVNLSQSTNDAYPTAMRIAIHSHIDSLVKAAMTLAESFQRKADEFRDIIKMGRTQLQDAVPMTLGQEFQAFATGVYMCIPRLKEAQNLLLEINLGGTAIGTGINSHPEYAKLVEKKLQEITGKEFVTSKDLVEATQDTSAYVHTSNVLKGMAVRVSKICNDLRLLSSGPRTGINEINLPRMQPGSSIMPGKVNPVIPEVVNQVCYQVIGNDVTISIAAEGGQLELNVFEPVIAFGLLSSTMMMRNAFITMSEKCVDGITANEEVCKRLVMDSIGLVTALNPYIGYENSAKIAKEALRTGRSVYDLTLEMELLKKEELDEILKPENMTNPKMASVRSHK